MAVSDSSDMLSAWDGSADGIKHVVVHIINERFAVVVRLRQRNVRSKIPRCIGFVGGKIKYDETPQETAVRKWNEETEDNISDLTDIGVLRTVYVWNIHTVIFVINPKRIMIGALHVSREMDYVGVLNLATLVKLAKMGKRGLVNMKPVFKKQHNMHKHSRESFCAILKQLHKSNLLKPNLQSRRRNRALYTLLRDPNERP